MTRIGRTSPKIARAKISNATTTSVAKKAGNTSTVGNNRACSDGESRKNKCRSGMPSTEDRVGSMQPICYGCG